MIRNKSEHAVAMAEYETYFEHEPAPGSPQADRFELLGVLLDHYETRRFPIEDADPVEIIRSVMEARGYTQGDLSRLFGSPSRASEVLNRKRDLSIDQIRRLTREWDIPAEALIGIAHRTAA